MKSAIASARLATLDNWSSLSRANSIVTARRIVPVTALLVGVVVANWLVTPDSISNFGLDLLLAPAIPVALASLAQMFVVLAGDFDVGVGSAVGLVNVIAATLLVHNVIVAVGAFMLVIGGYVAIAVIREFTGVPTVVVTLGASFIWLGVGLEVQPSPGGSSPTWLTGVLSRSLPGIPEPIYILAFLIVAASLLLNRWRYGVVLRGLGASAEAVGEAGRSPRLARLVLWAIAGICVVLAGIFVTVVSGGSDINASTTLTLSSFATLVVGGCEMSGGVVVPSGVVLASISFALISSLLTFENISASWVTAVTGVILIVAMSVRWLLARGGLSG